MHHASRLLSACCHGWAQPLLEHEVVLLQRTAFNTRTVDEMIQDKSKSGAEMKRTLGWFQLMCMGIGAIIGSGIYVL